MAHYAVVDSNNIVTGVLTGRDEDDLDNLPDGYANWEEYYSIKICGGATVIRTSYNTQNGQHLLGGTAFRGNFAGKGYIYNETHDVFHEPQPYPSWILNTTNWNWDAPVAKPSDYATKMYSWNESAYQADTNDPKTAGWIED